MDIYLTLSKRRAGGSSSSFYEDILPYLGQDVFVTFRGLNKVGIKPVGGDKNTPTGVYAYRVKDYVSDIKRVKSIQAFPFHGLGAATNVFLLKRTSNRILDLDVVDRQAEKMITTFAISERSLSRAKEYMRNIGISDVPAGLFWWGLYFETDENPAKFNKALRQKFDVVYDTRGIVHMMEKRQTIFLTPKAYKSIVTISWKQHDPNRKKIEKFARNVTLTDGLSFEDVAKLWPWLLDADVTHLKLGKGKSPAGPAPVVYQGTWNSGDAEVIIWKDGTFKDGTVKLGQWFGGAMLGGNFLKGAWKGGSFKGGTFNGTWRSGNWLGGYDKSGTYHGAESAPNQWR